MLSETLKQRKMENEDIKEDVLSSIDSIDRKRPREPCREDDNQHVERRVRLMRPQYEEKELEEEGTFSVVCDQNELQSNNNYLNTHYMSEAGLGDASMIYMRKECNALWQKLSDFQKDTNERFYISGPPGSGKSSLAWNWVVYCACKCNETIIWLHLFKTFPARFVVMKGKEGKFYRCGGDVVVKSLKKLIKDSNCQFVVIDGVTNESFDRFFLDSFNVRKIVYISSLSVPFSLEEMKDCQEFTMPSWSENDYDTACGNLDFVESIRHNLVDENNPDCDIEELRRNKFFLAGYCARWYFGMTVEIVTKDIKLQIQKIKHKDYVKDLTGSRSEGAVNHLLANINGQDVLVSEYAARIITLKCELHLIKNFLGHDVVKKPPAFSGWVVELNFLARLRTSAASNAKEISVYSGTKMEVWSVKDYTEFDPLNITQLAEWLIPKCWNQGGYDFIQIDIQFCVLSK